MELMTQINFKSVCVLISDSLLFFQLSACLSPKITLCYIEEIVTTFCILLFGFFRFL